MIKETYEEIIALEQERQNHNVELIYSTPFLDLGIKLSVIGLSLIIVLFAVEIFRHKNERRKK